MNERPTTWANRTWPISRVTALAVMLATLWTVSAVGAQWVKHRTPDIPRTADGTPDLAAPTPRTADGKPDF